MARRRDNALFRECRNVGGSVERARALITQGADVNRHHKYGNTALIEAAYHGRTDFVALLLAHGAEVNRAANDGGGPLYWAASMGRLDVVELLLAHGADIHALRDSDLRDSKLSILWAAIGKGHFAVVQRLVSAGASLDQRYLDRPMPEYAEWCGEHAIAEMLRRARRSWHA